MDLCLVLAGGFIWPKDSKALILLEILSRLYSVIAYQKDAVDTHNCNQAHLWHLHAESILEDWGAAEGIPIYIRNQAGWGFSGGLPITRAKAV